MRLATRRLGEAQAALLAVGGVLGAGLFIGVGEGLRTAGAGLIVLFGGAAVLAGLVTRALGSLALAQGGAVSFVATTAAHLGRRTAFVQGWGYWGAAVLACMAQLTAAGALIASWTHLPPWSGALAGLLLTAALNRSRVDLLGAVESWLSAAKIAALAPVIVLALASVLRLGTSHAGDALALAPAAWAPQGPPGWLAALPLALFAFGNVELVGLAAVDLADARRTLARTIWRVVAILAALYMGVTAALLVLLPPHALDQGANPLALVLARTGLPGAAPIMEAVLVWVMISSCNACLYGATRVLDALATEHCAPAALMTRNAHGAPGRATALTTLVVAGAVVLSALAPGPLFLPLMAGAAMLGLINWSLFLLAHRRMQAGHAWPDIAGLAAITLALVLMAVQPPFHAATGVVVTALVVLIALSTRLDLRLAGQGKASAPSGSRSP